MLEKFEGDFVEASRFALFGLLQQLLLLGGSKRGPKRLTNGNACIEDFKMHQLIRIPRTFVGLPADGRVLLLYKDQFICLVARVETDVVLQCFPFGSRLSQ